MSNEHQMPDAVAGREALAVQLRELEAFVAKSVGNGEALPPAAVAMIERLREIVRALDGLASSIDSR